MAERKETAKGGQKAAQGFTDEERAAMRERTRELRARPRASKENGEAEVLAKIAAMPGSDRVLAQRLHQIIRANAPSLTPRTWYGMPAYAKDDEIICFFQNASKFKARYATLGFSDEAKLDEGNMWPSAFALTQITATEEARIISLLKKALQ